LCSSWRLTTASNFGIDGRGGFVCRTRPPSDFLPGALVRLVFEVVSTRAGSMSVTSRNERSSCKLEITDSSVAATANAVLLPSHDLEFCMVRAAGDCNRPCSFWLLMVGGVGSKQAGGQQQSPAAADSWTELCSYCQRMQSIPFSLSLSVLHCPQQQHVRACL